MKRSRLTLAATVLLLLLSLSWAQDWRRGGGGGGGGLSPEQLLGYLALSPDIMLTDEQLLNARNVLRASYAEHRQGERNHTSEHTEPNQRQHRNPDPDNPDQKLQHCVLNRRRIGA